MIDLTVASPNSAVFVGGLDYQPNAQAVRWYISRVVPHLQSRGALMTLTVVGHCPDRLRDEFAVAGVRVIGFVEDLATEMGRHRMFVAPITSGTGLKVKILEAMAFGLPVVSTTRGVEGLDLSAGESVMVADSGASFAAAMHHLATDLDLATAVARAGRDVVLKSFSPAALRSSWLAVLDRLLTRPHMSMPEREILR